MNVTILDEQSMKNKFFARNEKQFLDFISKYDDQMVSTMKRKGFTYIHSMERTVVFTFGEITIRRRRWKKGNEWAVPVDEKLGLERNTRFSLEFMYQISQLATMMPYDKVVQVIELLYQVYITKPTVVKAVKLCGQLLDEKKEYRYFRDEEKHSDEKKKPDIIYIEGDGVWVKSRHDDSDQKNHDLSHFLVHTGSKQTGSNRFTLQDKKEFISVSRLNAKEQLMDYLYNHFEIQPHTLLITNSDGGPGYSPGIFKDIAKALKVRRHEHFWDVYHLNQELKDFFRKYPKELSNLAFQSIQEHNRSKLLTALDSAESLISTKEEQEGFRKFKSKLLNNFQDTKPAELRGLESAGIGVMESQHRKVTYRMKNRGMYWSLAGADTMSQMIVLTYEGNFRDLFFGSWREEYRKIEEINSVTGGTIFEQSKQETEANDVRKLNLKKRYIAKTGFVRKLR